MDAPLPDSFDVIIIGTGLQESILSGAFSRIDKKVLHLDSSEHYGSDWASFNIKSFAKYIKDGCGALDYTGDDPSTLCSGEEEIVALDKKSSISNATTTFYLQEAKENNIDGRSSTSGTDASVTASENELPPTSVDDDAATSQASSSGSSTDPAVLESASKAAPKQPRSFPNQSEMMEKWRHFNIDLTPKVLFSRGALVELLIHSNVSRYLEFRNVTRTLTVLSDTNHLQHVPCSRADIFNSKFVSVIEKRMIMKVLTFCMNYEEDAAEVQEYRDRPYREFLQSQRLGRKIQNFIIYSIAMVDDSTTTLVGLKATQKFLKSLGRYGNSAFLWPMYGIGELPQAFCRLSAVFGGTFCLRRSAVYLIINKQSGKCSGIIDNTGKRISANHVILNESMLPQVYCDSGYKKTIYRSVYVADKSVLNSDIEEVSLITIPPKDDFPSVRLFETGPICRVCPAKHYVVHGIVSSADATTNSPVDIQSLFKNAESVLFEGPATPENEDAMNAASEEDGKKPYMYWASYYAMHSEIETSTSKPSNVHVCRGPDGQLGFDEALSQARGLFERVLPEDEFLPRAPDPDEIIFDDEGYNTEHIGTGDTNNTPDVSVSDDDNDMELEQAAAVEVDPPLPPPALEMDADIPADAEEVMEQDIPNQHGNATADGNTQQDTSSSSTPQQNHD